jgi:hypothetical protein
MRDILIFDLEELVFYCRMNPNNNYPMSRGNAACGIRETLPGRQVEYFHVLGNICLIFRMPEIGLN